MYLLSHQYAMAEWKPNQSVQIQGRDVRLWAEMPPGCSRYYER